MRDMVERGRQTLYYGEDHPQARLTWVQIDLIRSMTGVKYKDIESVTGVDKRTVGKILRNEIWKDENRVPH